MTDRNRRALSADNDMLGEEDLAVWDDRAVNNKRNKAVLLVLNRTFLHSLKFPTLLIPPLYFGNVGVLVWANRDGPQK